MASIKIHRMVKSLAMVCICLHVSLLNAQPAPKRPDVQVKQVVSVGTSAVRIKRDPASGILYVVQHDGIIQRVDFQPDSTAILTTVYQQSDHGLSAPLGATFGQDGTMFLVGNDSTGVLGTASIVKGVPDPPGSQNRIWSVIARTVVFPYGHTYNHRMSGIIVSPSGDSLYVNSGAATDHGELREGNREVGLTSVILKLPINGQNIVLQNDREWLRTNGYLCAEGIRNTFDFAYAGNGDIFGVENSGDRDDPDELNWIRQGHHYGFPWRMGGDITPQQFSPYNPMSDAFLNPTAWGGGSLYTTFSDDPAYPHAPDSITFTEPVPSWGPDADRFHDSLSGTTINDASILARTIPTFTPHRSPDGIVFDRDSVLGNGLRGGGFVVCLGNSGLVRAMKDTSEDLLHVALTKTGNSYTAHVTRLVSGFHSPIGVELSGHTLYVLETGLQGGTNVPRLWAVTLPAQSTTGIDAAGEVPIVFKLDPNFPNPFNPSTTITYTIPQSTIVNLTVYNTLGQIVRTLVNNQETAGRHSVQWDGKDSHGMPAGSGVYFCRLSAGTVFSSTQRMLLLK